MSIKLNKSLEYWCRIKEDMVKCRCLNKADQKWFNKFINTQINTIVIENKNND